MNKAKVLKTAFILMVTSLLSIPAFAQLSLDASADASASTDTGADATATGDAESDAATEEPAAEEEPAGSLYSDAPAEAVAEETSDKPGGDGVAGWDKGFYIKTSDDKFKLKINGMMKTRFTLTNDEYFVIGDDGQPGTNHTNHASFVNNYARILLTGHVFTDRLTYALYHNFPTNALVYAYADWAFVKNKAHIRVGRFKRPFSRNYLNSSVKRQFVHDPTGQMGNGVDIGIQLSNNYTSVKGLEWAIGVFNSTPYTANGTPDFAPVLVGRIGFNNDKTGYSHTDFDGGPLRFGVALSASTEFDHDANDATAHYIGLDGIIKVQGLSLSAAFYLENLAVDAMFDDAALNRIGSFIQGGFLINKRFEPVARYGFVHSYQSDEDIQEEITAGFTIYFFGQNFKWENNFSLLTERLGPDADPQALQDIRFSSQMQFMF